jgi:NADPH:quinone reductase-like Zn-dependent oxidoreductase
MRAVGIPAYGGPEVLQVVELPVPEPAEEEIRVRVAAATINPADVMMREGALAALLTGEPPFIPGLEAAGTVDATGPGATWQVGDQVIVHSPSTGRGTQAEYVVVHSDQAGPVPRGASLIEAATLPMNGITVRHALDLAALAPGQTLVVTGAAGAVGGYAVQIGAAEGVHVVAIASAADEELVRGFGASEFVARDGSETLAARIRAAVPDGADALLDAALVGGSLMAAVCDRGLFLTVRPGLEIPSQRDIRVESVRSGEYLHEPGKREQLVHLVEEGKLILRVADTVPPENAADGYRRLEAGGLRGRLLITF